MNFLQSLLIIIFSNIYTVLIMKTIMDIEMKKSFIKGYKECSDDIFSELEKIFGELDKISKPVKK